MLNRAELNVLQERQLDEILSQLPASNDSWRAVHWKNSISYYTFSDMSLFHVTNLSEPILLLTGPST